MRARYCCAIVAVTIGLWWSMSRHELRPAPAGSFDDFVRTVAATRPLVGRLAGGFAYAPIEEKPKRTNSTLEVLGAVRQLRAVYPRDSHEALIADVFTGRLESAIDGLERLLARRPKAPATLAS